MTTTALNKQASGADSGLTVRRSATANHPEPAAPDFSADRAAHTTATTPEEVLKLRNAVNFMDCLSQSGFSEITAIAKLALLSLETPDGHRHLDNIEHALNAIWARAEDIENCINSTAEDVGCHYVDESQRRRWAARQAARDLRDAA